MHNSFKTQNKNRLRAVFLWTEVGLLFAGVVINVPTCIIFAAWPNKPE